VEDRIGRDDFTITQKGGKPAHGWRLFSGFNNEAMSI
jgi:hypothetical protein